MRTKEKTERKEGGKKNITIDIALVYTATIIMEYKDIEKKIKLLIERLQNECL